MTAFPKSILTILTLTTLTTFFVFHFLRMSCREPRGNCCTFASKEGRKFGSLIFLSYLCIQIKLSY